jgi:hypothetical protein
MDLKHLIAVEKWTCVLGALVVLASTLLLGRHAAFAVSMGAGLMVLNAYALRRIGLRVFRTFKRPSAAILLFNLKMLLLVALVFAVVHYLNVDPIAFIVGVSILPLAIVIVAVEHALRGQAGGDGGPDDGADHADHEETPDHG